MRLGEKIGEPKNIDEATSLVSRGKFPRMCVKIDITKPLVSKFILRRKVRRIEYEGLHLICFNCGVYGHTIDQCKKDDEKEDTEQTVGDASISAAGNKQNQRKQEVTVHPEVVDDYGPWMIAWKPTRRNTNRWENQEQGGTNTKEMGSRFGVLEGDQTEFDER